MKPSFDLTGKSALITGASSGIGKASAFALASYGANVTLVARSKDKLNQNLDELSKLGLEANVLALDITDIEKTQALVEKLGPFDILVNSAGTSRHALAVETSEDDFDYVINLNLKAAFFLTRAVAKGLLLANKPGSLINISSQMGLVGGNVRSVYCASKFAVEGFTKAMAIELGPKNIRVNTICPTFIVTPLTENVLADKNQHDKIIEKIKLNRLGNVDDITGAIIYLASNASSLVTGSSLVIDGGWTAD